MFGHFEPHGRLQNFSMASVSSVGAMLKSALSAIRTNFLGRTRMSAPMRTLFVQLKVPLLNAYRDIYKLLKHCSQNTSEPDLDAFLDQILELCHGRQGFERAAAMLQFLEAFFDDLFFRLEATLTPVPPNDVTDLQKLCGDIVDLCKTFTSVLQPTFSCRLCVEGNEDDELATVTVVSLPDLLQDVVPVLLDTLLLSAEKFFYQKAFEGEGLKDVVLVPTRGRGMVPPSIVERLEGPLKDFLTRLSQEYASADFVHLYINYQTTSLAMRVYQDGKCDRDVIFIRLC
eukprot:m.175829 g.175829  ORF g.175829 m.175829 type:complete len:286 (+) comp9954_c0_seq1:200-1057(+)